MGGMQSTVGVTSGGIAVSNFTPLVTSSAPSFVYNTPSLTSSTQIKNDPSFSTLRYPYLFTPYYASGNPDVGFDAPDMHIFDISNRSSPSIVGTLPTNGTGNAYDLALSGNYVYIAYYKSSLMRVIDVSNVASPSVVATLAVGDQPTRITINGYYAYIVTHGGSLVIVNITDPKNPSIVSTTSIIANFPWTNIKGSTAFVSSNASTTFTAFDVSNPASPSSKGTVTLAGFVYTFQISGNYVYVLQNSANKLQIIDITNPASMSVVGTVSTSTNPQQGFIRGQVLYLVSGIGTSLQTISISDPTSPTVTGTYTLDGSVSGVAVTGDASNLYILGFIDPHVGTGDLYGYLKIYGV